jgi:hypothetical protein
MFVCVCDMVMCVNVCMSLCKNVWIFYDSDIVNIFTGRKIVS